MRVFLMAAIATLACCKKSAPEVLDAGPPPAPAKPKVEAPVQRALPSVESTLSLLDATDAGCAWKTLDPTTNAVTTLATFDGTCVGAKLFWNKDGSRALAWFDPTSVQGSGYFAQTASAPGYAEEKVDPTAKPRLFSVDVRTGRVSALSLPAVTEQLTLDELGMSDDGTAYAFLTEQIPDEVRATNAVTSHGKTFDLSDIQEGEPALAHALEFTDGGWTHRETKVTTTGWDYAMGVQALDAFSTIGPRSTELSSSNIQGDEVTPAEKKALQKLSPREAKTDDDGTWVFIGAGGSRVYVWEITAEFAFTTGLLATGSPPHVLEKLGFTDGEIVSVRASGPYVLVTASGVGTHPRLYRLPEGRLVFASDTARAVSFWPMTVKPDSHEK